MRSCLPRRSRPSRAPGKGCQAGHQRCLGVSTGLAKPCQQGCRQWPRSALWHQVTAQTPVADALGKDIPEVFLPTVDGRSPHPAKRLESFKGVNRVPLAQSANQQQHGSPVDPATPEPYRWWQDPTTATGSPAAQTETNLKCLFQIPGPTPRLARVVGAV